MNQYPREDELDSVDPEGPAAQYMKRRFGKSVVIHISGHSFLGTVREIDLPNVDGAWPNIWDKENPFLQMGVGKLAPETMELNFRFENADVMKEIDEHMRELTLAYDNFKARYGEEEFKKLNAFATTQCYDLTRLMQAYEAFVEQNRAEQNRREELKKVIATLSVSADYKPSGKHGRSERDNIPVPKKYSRNRHRR